MIRLPFRTAPKDLALKAISLCLGIFLWFFVVGEDQVDINIQVPIEILNLPADLVISNQFKKEIEVSIRGPRSLIQEIRNQNITRPIDLSGAKPGTVVVQNDPDSIPFPRGITVLRLQPANITLLLDRLVQKDLPINPITEGSPAPGYVLSKITLEPDHLTISGPKAVLDSTNALTTYVINLDGLDHSTTLQVHLNLSQELLDLIGETVVTVKLEVREKFVERTVHSIPVNVRTPGFPVQVKPSTVSVVASIPENLVRDTPELSMLFRASLTVKNLTGPKKLPVTVSGVSVPGHESIKIIATRPEQVLVIPLLEKSPAKKKAVSPKNKTKIKSDTPTEKAKENPH
ncbi:CdaR family protein [Desulfolithobacter sp.]